MNPIIKKQLELCKVANIPEFDNNTVHITIPKGSNITVTSYQIGKCYLIEIADFVLNPSEDSTLSSNWNNGTVPKYKYYKCEITKLLGKMVGILGCGVDPITMKDSNDLWEGWIPQSGIKLIKEL